MVYSIDKEGRLNIPDGLMELSLGLSTKKVVLAEENQFIFRLISMDEIPDDAKIVAGAMTLDNKRRIVLPKQIREKCDAMVQIYVKARKLYIEIAPAAKT